MPVKESTSEITASDKDFLWISGKKVLELISNGKKILSNPEVDMELQSGTYDRLTIGNKGVGFLTGTVLVCEAPGKEFGKKVECQGIVFEVPEKYQGKKDVALILDNSTLKIEVRNGELLLTAEVWKCHTLPAENGWGIPDTDTGIPTEVTNKHLDPKDRYRYLQRSDGPYIGPIVRGLGNGDTRQTVYIGSSLEAPLLAKEVSKRSQDEPRYNKIVVRVEEMNVYCGQNGLKELCRVDAA